jgi:large subunit ribosomal protein L35Ae
MAASEAEPRLYVEAVFTSFRRNKRNLHTSQVLLKIDGVNSKEEAAFYTGKKVAAPYRGTDKAKDGFNYGKISQPHGNNGIVRASFDRNLPPAMLGSKVRVFLVPSTI